MQHDTKGDSYMNGAKTLGVFLVAVLLAGCSLPTNFLTGSGNVVTREETFSDFDKLNVSHAFTVDVSQGEEFSVVIHIDDNVVEHLRVTESGGTLAIGLAPNFLFSIRSGTLRAEVTMPELTGPVLSGASRVSITGFKSTNNLSAELSGASRLQGDLDAGDAIFEVSGASRVALSGSAEKMRIDASGASQLDLEEFAVADADVKASGASTITVNPSGTLDVDASGASRVYYLGSPAMGKIDTSGASSIGQR